MTLTTTAIMRGSKPPVNQNPQTPPYARENAATGLLDKMIIAWVERWGGALVNLEAVILCIWPRKELSRAIFRLEDRGLLRLDPYHHDGDGWIHLEGEG